MKVKISMKKEPQWKNIKLSGNLLPDDGGPSLEGLLGLEVLENYDGTLSVTKEKPIEVKLKKTSFKENSDNDDDDFDFSRYSKNERKRKKQKLKREKRRTAHFPGRFVRSIPNTINLSANEGQVAENHDKSENLLTSDDLTAWAGLGIAQPILKLLAEKGFKEPTEIQALTIPAAILGRRDILGAAETGSGKTLAFGIPIINGILEMKKNPERVDFRKVAAEKVHETEVDINAKASNSCQQNKPKLRAKNRQDRENLTPPPDEIDNFPHFGYEKDNMNEDHQVNENINKITKPLYALILTPTRELAVQVKDHLAEAAKYTDIHVAVIFGGLAAVKQQRILSKCPEIVVATPGRLWELLNEGNTHLNKLQNINFLVVDETDRMIERGHFEELKLILERLNMNPSKRAQRQNFIFSATLTMTHELPQYLRLKNMNRKRKFQAETVQQKLEALIEYFDISKPKIIDITQSENSARGLSKKLTECRISCSHEQKDLYLYYFLQKHQGRTIVFCNSIDCVRRLAKLFSILKCNPLTLHAKMAQRARLKSLENFTKNPIGLLIATDVAARGLDIPNVEHVIHYQVPRTSENYIHRSGRTARGNKEGIAVLIMEPNEIKQYVKLCRTLKRSEDLPIFPVNETYLAAVRKRVNLARKIDTEELRIRRKTADTSWLKKSAKEMDMLLDDASDLSEVDFYGSDSEHANEAEQIKARRQLKHLKDSLKHAMSKPIFPKGLGCRFPTTIQIDENTPETVKTHFDKNNGNSIQNAVKIMKNSIEEYKAAKKTRKHKFI